MKEEMDNGSNNLLLQLGKLGRDNAPPLFLNLLKGL